MSQAIVMRTNSREIHKQVIALTQMLFLVVSVITPKLSLQMNVVKLTLAKFQLLKTNKMNSKTILIKAMMSVILKRN